MDLQEIPLEPFAHLCFVGIRESTARRWGGRNLGTFLKKGFLSGTFTPDWNLLRPSWQVFCPFLYLQPSFHQLWPTWSAAKRQSHSIVTTTPSAVFVFCSVLHTGRRISSWTHPIRAPSSTFLLLVRDECWIERCSVRCPKFWVLIKIKTIWRDFVLGCKFHIQL